MNPPFFALIDRCLHQVTALVSLVFAEETPAEDGGFLGQLFSNPLILPAGVIFIFYITFLGPERRRKAEEAKLMSAMKKNDRVITIGGIHGTIVSVSPDSDVVTLKLDDSGSHRMKVNRSAIASIVPDKKNEKDGSAKDKDTT